MRGYPYLYRMFPFERRPVQLLAGFLGINTSPAWSPDGRSVALTLSKDGNPEIYVLNVATGRVPPADHASAASTPSRPGRPPGARSPSCPTAAGRAQVYVMDAEGANVRRLTQGGFNTQPRWSPKGDTIVFTSRQGNSRPVGGRPGRIEPAAAHRRARRQRERLVGAERPPPRLPVERAGAASRSSPCSPTAPSSSRSRAAPGTRQVLLGRRGFRDRIACAVRAHRCQRA